MGLNNDHFLLGSFLLLLSCISSSFLSSLLCRAAFLAGSGLKFGRPEPGNNCPSLDNCCLAAFLAASPHPCDSGKPCPIQNLRLEIDNKRMACLHSTDNKLASLLRIIFMWLTKQKHMADAQRGGKHVLSDDGMSSLTCNDHIALPKWQFWSCIFQHYTRCQPCQKMPAIYQCHHHFHSRLF